MKKFIVQVLTKDNVLILQTVVKASSKKNAMSILRKSLVYTAISGG